MNNSEIDKASQGKYRELYVLLNINLVVGLIFYEINQATSYLLYTNHSIITFFFVVMALNIWRIKNGQYYKKLYVAMCALNLLSMIVIFEPWFITGLILFYPLIYPTLQPILQPLF